MKFLKVKLSGMTNPGLINLDTIESILPKQGNQLMSVIAFREQPEDPLLVDEPTSSIEAKLYKLGVTK